MKIIILLAYVLSVLLFMSVSTNSILDKPMPLIIIMIYMFQMIHTTVVTFVAILLSILSPSRKSSFVESLPEIEI